MPKFSVVYTIEGTIEFEAATAKEAQRKFNGLDQRELGELGVLIQHTDPPVEEVEEVAERVSNGTSQVVGAE